MRDDQAIDGGNSTSPSWIYIGHYSESGYLFGLYVFFYFALALRYIH